MGKRNPKLAMVFHAAADPFLKLNQEKSSEEIFNDKRIYKDIERTYQMTLEARRQRSSDSLRQYEIITEVQLPSVLCEMEERTIEAAKGDADTIKVFAWINGINMYRQVIFGFSAALNSSEFWGLRMLKSLKNHPFQDESFREGFNQWEEIFWKLWEE